MTHRVGDQLGEQEQRVVGVRVAHTVEQVTDVAASLRDGGDLRGKLDLPEQPERAHRATCTICLKTPLAHALVRAPRWRLRIRVKAEVGPCCLAASLRSGDKKISMLGSRP
ncbi:hypothetical protein OIE13_21955 [Streptosporangium sp. NBC_01810]|uniref:hypothetical protein n=1 Tax=Streptosporangium sp. NBC_01810 TaxID=2975951 RepID=UPI002DD98304|nr:hypothetical protein [Streptosporangium sp. NBC_01810]WSA29795.1 hypothetical protein OIE13_21955 [Streptosporangium sp. NBC_01810]